MTAWRFLLHSTATSRDVHDAMHEVTMQDAVLTERLKSFSDGLREVIQKIESRVPIEGKGELGFRWPTPRVLRTRGIWLGMRTPPSES